LLKTLRRRPTISYMCNIIYTTHILNLSLYNVFFAYNLHHKCPFYVHITYTLHVIICPIAIAYSMGQIIKPFCVCVSFRVSVYEHSNGRISWSMFTKIGTDVKTPKSNNDFVGHQHCTTSCPTLPPKTSSLCQKVLKIHANINNRTSSVNVNESPKFSNLTGNRGRGIRWWRQSLHRKWNYGRFVHAQWKMCNITLIFDRIAENSTSYSFIRLLIQSTRNHIKKRTHKNTKNIHNYKVH